jgi:putative phage-type endonuclease
MCATETPTTQQYVHPQVARLLARGRGYEQKSAEWLALRRELLTASDAAAALNIKPYKSFSGSPREDLMRRKLSNATFSSAMTAHGNLHEDDARRAMCEVLGETVYDFGLITHPSLPWLGASPDGITASGKMVEIKCPVSRPIIPGHVPEHYYPQLQIQMEVCDLDQAIFVQYKPATPTTERVLSISMVARDRQWFSDNADTLFQFWSEYTMRRKTYVAPPPPRCMIDDALYAAPKRQKIMSPDCSDDDE